MIGKPDNFKPFDNQAEVFLFIINYFLEKEGFQNVNIELYYWSFVNKIPRKLKR